MWILFNLQLTKYTHTYIAWYRMPRSLSLHLVDVLQIFSFYILSYLVYPSRLLFHWVAYIRKEEGERDFFYRMTSVIYKSWKDHFWKLLLWRCFITHGVLLMPAESFWIATNDRSAVVLCKMVPDQFCICQYITTPRKGICSCEVMLFSISGRVMVFLICYPLPEQFVLNPANFKLIGNN